MHREHNHVRPDALKKNQEKELAFLRKFFQLNPILILK